MPRSRNHGGPRQGAPGVSYANRTDLNADRAAPASAMPATPPPPQQQPAQQQPAPQVTPDMTPFPADPTARPSEPVTAGLSPSLGATPSLLNQAYIQSGIDALRGVYAATGDMRVLSMIEFHESFR